MAKLTEKQMLLTVVGTGVFLAGIGGAGIWWAKGLIEEEKKSIEKIQAETKTAEGKIKKIPDVESDVITLRENVGEYVKILPEDDYITNFIRNTQKFLGQSGVRIKNITPGKPGNKGKFDQYSYRLVLDGTLWQFLKFINEFESFERFVRVKEFALSSGDGKQELLEGGEVLHQITMEVETFVYRGASKGGKSVNIANYAGKRERLRERILENALAIKLRRYEFKDAQGRRDIFVDPRQSSAVAAEGGNPLEMQQQRIEQYSGDLQAALGLVERIDAGGLTYLERAKLEKELRTRIADVKEGVRITEEQQLISWPPFRLKWNNEVLGPLAVVEKKVSVQQQRIADRWLSAEQLANLLQVMRQDMSDGKFDELRERYVSVQSRLGVEPEDERYPMVERIEVVMLYVDAISEFSEFPLSIDGVVVQGDGRSGLLINGNVMEEGEYVSDELVLKTVRAESAEFLYKGFVIVKNW